MQRIVRRTFIAALALVSVSAVVPYVQASPMHLRLVKSEPSKDATVDKPTQLKLWFSMKPTMSITAVKLTSASDAAVELGKPTFDGDVANPVEVPITGALAPGKYTVSWKTASSDMHPQTGDFSFTVK